MKKILLIGFFTLTVICGVFASGLKDETVVNLGYTMPTVSAFDVDDAENYTKSLSNGMDISFRTYDSGLFGTYIGCDILWPHKITQFYGDDELGSRKYDDMYDDVSQYDVSVGIYSPILNFGFVKVPFGAGIHANLMVTEIEKTYYVKETKETDLNIGFNVWAKAEISLTKNIGLYAGLDVTYDFYGFNWIKVGKTDPETSQDKIKNWGIAPSVGVAFRF